jgi:hypothetical protein
MKTSFVKTVPHGDFVAVSALTSDWQTQLQILVSNRQPINYDFYPLPNIPLEVMRNLEQAGYHDLVLENDQWQHYFVPNLN